MNDDSIGKVIPRSNYSILGHKQNIDFLIGSFLNNSMHHAYIFSGNKGIGKATLAYAIARNILSGNNFNGLSIDKNNKVCKLIEANSHPDLLVIEPEDPEKKTFISIDQVRKCSEFFNQTPSISNWRICILDSIDFMDISSTNTILKILEEPPTNCLFLIISHNVEKVIDTIKSRCLELKFQNLKNEIMIKKIKILKPNLLKNEIDRILDISEGSIGKLINLSHSDSLKIQGEIDKIFNERKIDESVYNFSDFILKEDTHINKFEVFIDVVNNKLNSFIKELAINNTNFIQNSIMVFKIRDTILNLISQERIFKLNKKQVIVSIISNLNKITKLQ